jgi:hypothetical protein
MRSRLSALIVALLSICLICPACTTTSQVSLRPSTSGSQVALEPGRKALIRLRSGDEVKGTVVATDETSLTLRTKSDSIRAISFADMESLEASRFLPGRTAAVIGGALLVAFGGWYVAMVSIHADDE